MFEQESENLSEFSGYDIKGNSIAEIPQLNEVYQNIQILRVMHSPNLKSMKGLDKFLELKEINLSSNNIERIESLENLRHLKILDLSCNKIRVINGLGNLFELEKLNLSHNKIINIQNLKQIAGDNNNLKYLDLSDNKIQDYKELLILNRYTNQNILLILKSFLLNQSLPKLETLFFEQDKNSNPICKKKNYYHEVLQNLKYFKHFQIIDGKKPEILFDENLPEKLKEKENIIFEKNSQSPIKQQKNSSSPFDVTKLKYKNVQSLKQNENFEDVPNNLKQNEVHAKESEYKTEIVNLKSRLEEMILDQKDLIYKYEMSEKFWENKCEKMEKELSDIYIQNRSHKKEIKILSTENIALKQELDTLKKEHKENMVKKDRKDDMVENLQQRISTLLKENGEYHKEIVLRTEESDRLKQENKSNEQKIKELKISVRENEKILAEFHSKSLENASFTLHRGEEMKRKFESIYEENKVLMTENSDLKQKNSGLLDLTKEWEYKFDSKINEMKYEFEREMKKMIDTYEKQIFELSHQLNFTKKEQEVEFKKNLDLLEDEFKKVLNENNEKFRQLKFAYDDKNKNESDLKNLLKAALMKNHEQEQNINEFEQSLFKIKKEVAEIIAERDLLQKEVNVKRNTKDKEYDFLKEEKERIEHEKALIENNCNNIKEMRNKELNELNNLRNKLLKFEHISNEMDDMRDHIETKTKMLDDKNETIENLKEENENIKQNYSSLNEDFVKLSNKFDKQTEIVDELEQQYMSLKEENEMMKKELKEKKNLIKLFESEIDNIKQTQENEIINLKESCKKKDEKINEVLKTLDECKVNLQQNHEKLKEGEKNISEMEVQLLYKENELKNKIKTKDKEIDILKSKLEENEEEMKILITEIEKQKRMAKENIEKLNKIFNI